MANFLRRLLCKSETSQVAQAYDDSEKEGESCFGSSVEVKGIEHSIVNVASGPNASINVNIYKSEDYKDLLEKVEKARRNVEEYPENTRFKDELKTAQQQVEDFKRGVLELAESFKKRSLNTDQLRLAKQLFDKGEYQAVRDTLDAELLEQEQTAIIDEGQRFQDQQAEKLNNNATAFIFKAKATAIDYSLTDRIEQASQFFESALKSARTPENIFEYARFLQENNQFSESEKLYTEALESYRALAKDNPAVYLPYVAMTLNNLGNLVSDDSSRRSEAEKLYTEALEIIRKLAHDNPAVYLPYVATTLNNLGILVKADSSRRSEAEKLYTEALESYRKLAHDNPAVYLPDVAMTLNNLGNLVSADSSRRSEAEKLYTEALEIRRALAKSNPAVYLDKVAMTLNNLGSTQVLLKKSKEAKSTYKELSGIYSKQIEILKANNAGLDDIAGKYISIAFYELFNDSPQEAIAASLKGLELKPSEDTKTGLRTNLAHGYLFTNQYEKAKAIYLEDKDKVTDGSTFKDSVLDDFRQFRELGIEHPKMDEIAKLMGK